MNVALFSASAIAFSPMSSTMRATMTSVGASEAGGCRLHGCGARTSRRLGKVMEDVEGVWCVQCVQDSV